MTQLYTPLKPSESIKLQPINSRSSTCLKSIINLYKSSPTIINMTNNQQLLNTFPKPLQTMTCLSLTPHTPSHLISLSSRPHKPSLSHTFPHASAHPRHPSVLCTHPSSRRSSCVLHKWLLNIVHSQCDWKHEFNLTHSHCHVGPPQMTISHLQDHQ